MEFVESCLPLLIVAPPETYGEVELAALEQRFKRLWTKGERYALLHLASATGKSPTARERQTFQTWAARPEILGPTKALCVSVAVVTSSPLARGALTALLWIWTPPVPLFPVSNTAEGVELSLGNLTKHGLLSSSETAELRARALRACEPK